MLIWNCNGVLLLLCRALWRKTVEANLRLVRLQLMPVRNSQMQKIQEHAEKWGDNEWTTSQKKDMWEVFTMAWYTSQFLFKKLWRCQKPKPPLIKNEINWRKLQHGMWRRWDQSLKSSVRRRRMEKQITSRIWWTLSLEERRTCKTPVIIQGTRCAPGRQRQRRRTMQSSAHRARCFRVSDGSGQVPGHHLKVFWYGWRNKWRNFSVQVKIT